MVAWSIGTPRSSSSSSTWRERRGYARYHRTPIRMMSCGKWAPLQLIAIVVLPHDAPLVMKGDHTANGLKCKFATKPMRTPDLEARKQLIFDLQRYLAEQQ